MIEPAKITIDVLANGTCKLDVKGLDVTTTHIVLAICTMLTMAQAAGVSREYLMSEIEEAERECKPLGPTQ